MIASETMYAPENGCAGCYFHVRFFDAYGGSEQTIGTGHQITDISVTTVLNPLVDTHPAKGLIGGNLTFNVPSNTNLEHVRGFYVYASTH